MKTGTTSILTWTTATTIQVNGYLLHRIVLYQYEQLIDSKLWEYFKEDFEGWTIDTWNKGNREIIRHFRDFLCRNGVNVARNRALIANNIQSIIDNPDEPIWTREEIQRQMNEPMTTIFSNTSNFNSKHKPPGNGNNKYNLPPRDNGKDKIIQSFQSSVPQTLPQSSVPQIPPQSSVPQIPPQSSVPQIPPQSSVPQTPPQSSVPQIPPQSSVPQTSVVSSPDSISVVSSPDFASVQRL
jgi:hypothetical protein